MVSFLCATTTTTTTTAATTTITTTTELPVRKSLYISCLDQGQTLNFIYYLLCRTGGCDHLVLDGIIFIIIIIIVVVVIIIIVVVVYAYMP